MNKPALLALALLLGCTSQQPSAPAAAPKASQFKNLQVFARDIPRDDLIAAMKGFTRGLGVRCEHCHVVTATEPKQEFDFAADTKEEKRIARVMIQMTMQLNSSWMERIEAAEGHVKGEDEGPSTRVSCWTCHRGEDEPALPPPPPAPAPPPGS